MKAYFTHSPVKLLHQSKMQRVFTQAENGGVVFAACINSSEFTAEVEIWPVSELSRLVTFASERSA